MRTELRIEAGTTTLKLGKFSHLVIQQFHFCIYILGIFCVLILHVCVEIFPRQLSVGALDQDFVGQTPALLSSVMWPWSIS